MNKKQYNIMRDECRLNSCYHCYCNGTSRCFSDEIKPTIKDFPSRSFSQLSGDEKEKILKMEVDF